MEESRARRKMRAAIAERFSGDAAPSPRFLYGFRFVCPLGRALGFGARERSERVTARRQPRRQRSRRLVYSQAHALLPFEKANQKIHCHLYIES